MRFRITFRFAFLVTLVFVTSLFPEELYASSQAQTHPRTYEIIEQELLKNVLKVEIIDSGSQEFPRGLEVKITNISSKPIYHVNLHVVFPEAKKARGFELALLLRFGSPTITSISDAARQEHPSIKPNESYALKADDRQVADYRKGLKEIAVINGESISQVKLTFQAISFGDGTGYVIGLPYPQKSSRQLKESQGTDEQYGVGRQLPGARSSLKSGFREFLPLSEGAGSKLTTRALAREGGCGIGVLLRSEGTSDGSRRWSDA